jgi:hypothetical protein
MRRLYRTFSSGIISPISDEWKNIHLIIFFNFNMSTMCINKVLVEEAAHYAHGILIWSEIGAKPVERSELNVKFGELQLENTHFFLKKKE